MCKAAPSHFILAFFTTSTLCAAPIFAQEAIIYDGDNCTGDYRMLSDDFSDLHVLGFATHRFPYHHVRRF